MGYFLYQNSGYIKFEFWNLKLLMFLIMKSIPYNLIRWLLYSSDIWLRKRYFYLNFKSFKRDLTREYLEI